MSNTMKGLLDDRVSAQLDQIAGSCATEYQHAEPFPHIVIDNFLPPEPLEAALAEFPNPEELRWLKHENEDEKKLEFTQAERLPDSLRDILYFLNTPLALEFLERLTGISGLIGDTYFMGGGLHQIQRGGYLEVHADFNKHRRWNLDRRLNLLLYLNKDWKEEYGGHLELWDRSMSQCVKKILPVFNRCVVFNTTDTAFHGHPTPLSCPPEWSRKSIATYYYTNGRPETEAGEIHSTLFQSRPGTDKTSRKVLYTAKKIAQSLLPPIITDGVYHLRHRKPS